MHQFATHKTLLPFALLAAALLLGATSAAAQEPTLDEIVNRHLEARGGAEAWRAVRSMQAEGTYTAFSIRGPFTWVKDGERYHFDGLWGGKIVKIYIPGDGSGLWRNDWMGEEAKVAPMPPIDHGLAAREALLATPLLDWRERGLEVRFEGRGEIEGEEGWKLAVRWPEGSLPGVAGDIDETWYLDPSTYLEFARTRTGSDFGGPVDEMTFFDDFREVGALRVPYRIETHFRTRHRVMEIDAVRIDVELADDTFTPPAESIAAPPATDDGSAQQ